MPSFWKKSIHICQTHCWKKLTKPKILIGPDNGILTVGREVKNPRFDGPMMTKTKLGLDHTRISGGVKESRSGSCEHLM
jgi:hypothetical protein